MFLINISKYASIGEHSTVRIIADIFGRLGEDVEVNARQLQYIFVLKLIIVSTSLIVSIRKGSMIKYFCNQNTKDAN